nr:b3 domain-containing protein [Quercus suber]
MVLILTAQLKFSLIFTKLAFVFKFVFLQRIPKKFISEYGVDLSDMAFLTIPNGTKWKVKLIKHNGEVCFQNGWCKFASCHALTLGNLLVFRYEGNLEFSVLIFDATATEINYPTAEVQVSRMEDNESDDNSLEIIDDFMPSRKKGEKPPIPCPLPHKKAKTNPSSSKLEAGDTHFRPELTTSKGSMLEKSKMVFGVSFTRGESSRSAHRVGGVAKNLMRANALKSENLLFTVIIHPSYINGKDRASTTGDVPYEDMHGDPTAAVAKDSDDEVDVDTAIAAHTGPRPPFLRAMMETIMTTQTTHGQVLYGLLTDVAALQADLADYRRPDPPSPTSNS